METDHWRLKTMTRDSIDISGGRMWPHRLFTIDSPFEPHDAYAMLRDATESGGLRPSSPPTRTLDGTLTTTNFSLRVAADRRRWLNWSRPVLRGTLSPHAAGTRIAGTFELHPVVAVFLSLWAIWIGVMAALCIVSAGYDVVATALTGRIQISPVDAAAAGVSLIVVVALVLWAWLYVVGPFDSRARRAILTLAQLTRGIAHEDAPPDRHALP